MSFGNGTKSTFSTYGQSAYPLSLLHCFKNIFLLAFYIKKKPKEPRKTKELTLCKHTDFNRNTDIYLCSRAVPVPGSRR